MKRDMLIQLTCPSCHGHLRLEIAELRTANNCEEVWRGSLSCDGCRQIYPIYEGIPSTVAIDILANIGRVMDQIDYLRHQADSCTRGYAEAVRLLEKLDALTQLRTSAKAQVRDCTASEAERREWHFSDYLERILSATSDRLPGREDELAREPDDADEMWRCVTVAARLLEQEATSLQQAAESLRSWCDCWCGGTFRLALELHRIPGPDFNWLRCDRCGKEMFRLE